MLAREALAAGGVLLLSFVVLAGAAGFPQDVTVISSAFAAGHGAKGNGNGGGNGNGNGNSGGGGGGGGSGFENGNNDLSQSNISKSPTASALDSSSNGNGEAFAPPGQSRHQTDKDDAGGKWLVDKPLDLGAVDERFDEYVKQLDPDPKLNPTEHDPKVKDHEPKGKAVGRRRKEAERDGASPPLPHMESAPPSRAGAITIDPRSYSRGEVLAVNLSSAGVARAQALGFSVSASSSAPLEGMVTVLTVPPGVDALDALELLKQDLPAGRFLLNHLYRLYFPASKNDSGKEPGAEPAVLGGVGKCGADRCYAKAAIGWKDGFAACARGVRVGVIDTDIDLRHPAFAGQKITHSSILPDGKHSSANWHGTGVLALLAGRQDSGTPGLIHEADFYVASIFFADEDGESVTDTVSILKALDWMSASGAKLVNMSFAGPPDDLMQMRIETLSAQGFVFAAAAGNEGPAAGPSYPAAYPQVIAVTAIARDMRVYPLANRGAYIDVAAPGVRIWTAAPNAREGYRVGTSFAAPFVTAVLAIQQRDVLRPPKAALLNRLKTVNLGSSNRSPTYGRGLLQAPGRCPGGQETIVQEAVADRPPLSGAPRR